MSFEKAVGIARRQEELLVYDKFDHEDALALGLKVAALAGKNYGATVSVRVDIEEFTVFYYRMQGRHLGNDWWMAKKLNGSRKTGRSSFANYLELRGKQEEYPWIEQVGNYALCGGCFPIRLKGGVLAGFVMCSGLKHEMDHQLLVDALSEVLGVPAPTVLDGTAYPQ
ncbi:MAG: heme-binding protein [Christensenellales bacterium]